MLSSARAMAADTPARPFRARQSSALAAQASSRLCDVPPSLVHALPDQFAQMRRIQHGAYSLAVALVHVRSSCGSVIVHQVHVHDFAALESEHHAPVAGHAHAPLAACVAGRVSRRFPVRRPSRGRLSGSPRAPCRAADRKHHGRAVGRACVTRCDGDRGARESAPKPKQPAKPKRKRGRPRRGEERP